MSKKVKRKALLLAGLIGVGLLSVFQSVVSLGSSKKNENVMSYSNLQNLLTIPKASADNPSPGPFVDPSCPAPGPCY